MNRSYPVAWITAQPYPQGSRYAPAENAARFSTQLITLAPPVNTATSGWRPVPVSEAECRCRAWGCETGRRARQDAEQGRRGRRPLRAVPLERRRSEGTRSAAKGRNVGCAFFCLLFFAPGGDPQAKKSESPARRNRGSSNAGKQLGQPTSKPLGFASAQPNLQASPAQEVGLRQSARPSYPRCSTPRMEPKCPGKEQKKLYSLPASRAPVSKVTESFSPPPSMRVWAMMRSSPSGR